MRARAPANAVQGRALWTCLHCGLVYIDLGMLEEAEKQLHSAKLARTYRYIHTNTHFYKLVVYPLIDFDQVLPQCHPYLHVFVFTHFIIVYFEPEV